MAITSADINNQSFTVDRKGYNVDEVDVFLEHVAHEIDLLNDQIEEMGNQIANLNSLLQQREEEFVQAHDEALARSSEDATALPADVSDDEKDQRIAELERMLEERRMDDNAIAQALITAQRSGEEVLSKAKADAETVRQDAEEEARRILAKANNEKQRILEAIEELQESRENVRSEYQELLRDFIGSATRTLADLGGEAPSGAISYISDDDEFYGDENTGRVAPRAQTPHQREVSSAVATYTTPQINHAMVTPAAPRPSTVEKDLSGYGDADDNFEFEDVE